MKFQNIYQHIERKFETLTALATRFLGNSVTFLFAVCLVLFWWLNDFFSNANTHQIVGDIIFGVTFLSLFIIQKSFNRYSAMIHLKINELISSHEPANNSVMNTNQKTEQEIVNLVKEYAEIEQMVEQELLELEDKDSKENNR